MQRAINYSSAFLVFLLAVGAFVLSYSALYDVAAAYGLPPKLAWIWPLLVDFALIVFSLAVVRASSQGESTWWPWALVGLFTVATIAFNLIHSRPEYVAWLVAIVPPVALILSFETLMAMLRGSAKRAGAIQSITEIEAESREKRAEVANEIGQLDEAIAAKQAELSGLTGQLEQLTGQLREEIEAKARAIETYNQDIEAKKRELKGLTDEPAKAYLPANITLEQKQELANLMANDGLTNDQIAGILGVSLATVKNYKKAAKEANVNGHNGKG